jgi:hypothetical protein
VEISAAFSADLRRLGDALELPGTDLEVHLRRLADNAAAAIGSFLGLAVTLIVDDLPVTFSFVDDSIDQSYVASSISIPLTPLCGAAPGSAIVLFAEVPGALVDFAADVAYVLQLEPEALVLDRNLGLPSPGQGIAGLDELSRINQGIGVLLDRGHTLEQARAELHRLARDAHVRSSVAAQSLLDSIPLG